MENPSSHLWHGHKSPEHVTCSVSASFSCSTSHSVAINPEHIFTKPPFSRFGNKTPSTAKYMYRILFRCCTSDDPVFRGKRGDPREHHHHHYKYYYYYPPPYRKFRTSGTSFIIRNHTHTHTYKMRHSTRIPHTFELYFPHKWYNTINCAYLCALLKSDQSSRSVLGMELLLSLCCYRRGERETASELYWEKKNRE